MVDLSIIQKTNDAQFLWYNRHSKANSLFSDTTVTFEGRCGMELSAVQDIRRVIEREQARLKALKSAVSAVVPERDGLPRAKALTSNVEGLAVQIITIQDRIAELKAALVDAATELTGEIFRRVSGGAAEVLVRRYVMGNRFRDIAMAMNYSESQIFSLHRRGKLAYSSILPRTAKNFPHM